MTVALSARQTEHDTDGGGVRLSRAPARARIAYRIGDE
jgi:hypothetical protein